MNDRVTFNRRQALKAGALFGTGAALGLSMPRRSFAAGEELTIMTWETYDDDPWLEEYQAKSGVKVNAIRIGSNDETFAKLQSGAVKPDLFVIDTGSIARFMGAKLLAPMDIAKVPNAANISSGLDYKSTTTVDGALRAIPYNWGTQPLMYNAEAFPEKPTSWKVLWEQQYAGKVSLPDDSYTVFPMITLAIGAKDPFNLTDEEFEKCAQAMREIRQQVSTLARGFDDQTAIFATGDAVVGYCQNISSVFQLQDKGKKVEVAYPAEGTPAWIDCWVMTEQGAGRQAAYDFLNEMLSDKWQSRFIQTSGNNGILSLDAAKAGGVTDAVLAKTNLKDSGDPEFWKGMVYFKNPESVDRRLEMWNAFKAGTL